MCMVEIFISILILLNGEIGICRFYWILPTVLFYYSGTYYSSLFHDIPSLPRHYGIGISAQYKIGDITGEVYFIS